MNGMDSLPDDEQDEIIGDKIAWTVERWRKYEALSVDERMELLVALGELCVVRRRRSEGFAELVDSGALCAECPCAWVAGIAGEECLVKPREESQHATG